MLQPSSALAGGALFVLMYGALDRAWSARRSAPPAAAAAAAALAREAPTQDREAQLQVLLHPALLAP